MKRILILLLFSFVEVYGVEKVEFASHTFTLPDSYALKRVAAPPLVQRPNVIVIMSDDQGGGDYGFMGNNVIRTPELDAMTQRSGLLSKFYVSPVCAPTRASLMTGRYNYRTRCVDTYVGRAMMDPAEVTIAELLRAADYHTGIYGKWHLGDNYPMRPMDQGLRTVSFIGVAVLGNPLIQLVPKGNTLILLC